MIKTTGNFLFKNRSYTPLPFVFLIILFATPTLLTILTGFSLVVLGELIRIWAVSYAGSETRTTGSVGGSQLVTQGPYSITRNPLYVGNVLIYTGVGIMSNSLFPYLQIFGFIYFVFQYYAIIISEEEYLKQTFTEKFFLYTKTVGRLFPTFKKIPGEINSNIKPSLYDGLKSEKRTFNSIIIITLIILLIYSFQIRIFAT
jgi:protein-S-isoprenylcysteine O-methyltransferase Ste14